MIDHEAEANKSRNDQRDIKEATITIPVLQTDEDIFREYLLLNEHIIWAGKPDLSIKFTDTDIFLIPFGMFWFLFSLFWEGAALFGLIHYIYVGDNQNFIRIIPFPFVGLCFVFIGYYLLFGRFKYKRRKNRNTSYALTNLRVLMLINMHKKILKTKYINTLKDVAIYRKKNNIGSIILGNSVIRKKIPFQQRYYENTGLDFFIDDFFYEGYLVFNDIANAEDVLKLIESSSGICRKN